MVTWRRFRRLLTVAFGAMVVVTALIAAQESVEATMAVVGALLILGSVLWWRRQREVATSVVALLLGCVATAAITEWVAVATEEGAAQQTGLAFWVFASVLTIAVWTSRRHPGNRGVTVILANAALTATSPLTAISPGSGALVGFVAGMVVVAWRGGGWLAARRWWWGRRPLPSPDGAGTTPGPDGGNPGPVEEPAPASVDDRIRGAQKTAEVIADLRAGWCDLGPRQVTKNSSRTDHLLLGPAHTLLIRTYAWAGTVTLLNGDDAGASPIYAVDDDPTQLAERLRPSLDDNLAAQLRLDETDETVWSVLVFWDSTRLPGRVVELDVLPENGTTDQQARIVLVRGERLTPWLESLTRDEVDDVDGARELERRHRIAARMFAVPDPIGDLVN